MELYLLRHGIAEDSSSTGRDEDRRLTEDGRTRLAKSLGLARKAGVAPTLIISSPLARALETATIAAEQLRYKGELTRSKSLTPEGSPAKVWEEVRTWKAEEQLLLVSHNPLCSSLTGYLLGMPDLRINFRKGALLRVDTASFGPAPRCSLEWLLTPKLMLA